MLCEDESKGRSRARQEVLEALRAHGDSLALLGPDGVGCSFAQLAATMTRVSDRLACLNPGHRILTLLPDEPTTALAIATSCLDATVIPANPGYTRFEVRELAATTKAQSLLVREYDEDVAVLAADLELGVIELVPRLTEHFADFDLHVTREPGPADDQDGDTAIILLTSGSTGTPKLVPHSLDHLVGSARSIATALELGTDDTCVHGLPMFHVGAIVDLFLAPLLAGGRVRFCHPFSSATAVEAIVESQATWFQGVPTMLHAVVSSTAADTLLEVGRSLRFIRSVSAALSPARQSQIEKSFGGVPVIQMYGMTESAGQICSNPLPPKSRKAGSVGIPQGAEVAIIDPFGSPVPEGRVGEVCVRGPSVMSGYLDVANSSYFFGGWLRTGDLGYVDSDGFLFLSGRLKDMVNRGGEKIPMLEVEQRVHEIDGVEQAACLAVPHPTLGEEVGVAIVPAHDARLSVEGVQTLLKGRLADFKVPRKVVFVDRLPLLASGKLDRQTLASAFEPDAPGNIDSAPETPLGQRIAELWIRILNAPPPKPSDDFFDSGGDSLAAQTFMMELEALVGRAMPANLLYEAPTFGELERALSQRDTNDDAPGLESDLPAAVYNAAKLGMAGWRGARRHANSLIVALRGIGEKTPFFFCTPTETSFVDLVSALSRDRPFYAMRTLWLQENRTEENERHLARHYATEIDDLQPTGNILLGGHCRGVEVARMIADELEMKGRAIALLVEVDFPVNDDYAGRVAQVWSNDHPLSWEFSEPERWIEHHYAGEVFLKRIDVSHRTITRGRTAAEVANFIEPIMDEATRACANGCAASPERVRQIRDRREARQRRLHSANIRFKAPAFGTAGETIDVPVSVTNTSQETWAPSHESGLRLLAKWQRPSRKSLRELAGACDLVRELRPGETVDLSLSVVFHRHSTPLYLCVDMVDEGIAWFHETSGKLSRHMIVPRYWKSFSGPSRTTNLVESR